MEDLSTRLQTLALQQKVAVSLEKTEPQYVLDLAAQYMGGADSLLAASSSNYSVRLFSRCRLAQTNVLTGHEQAITGIQFLHMDPNLVMTASHDKTVRIWDPRTSNSEEVQLFVGEDNTDANFLCCDISTSDRLLCAGTVKYNKDEVYILFWDRRKNRLLGCYEESHNDDITQVHFHPESENSLVTGSTDGLVNVFDVMQMSEDDALLSTYNTESSVERAGWCGPDAKHVYSTTHMCTWHVWNAEGDEDVQQVTDLAEKLEGKCKIDYLVDCIPATSSSEEVRIVTGTNSGDLHLLDLTDSNDVKVVKSLVGGHNDTVRCLHWDKQTDTLVTGGEDSMLCLWSPNGKELAPVLPQLSKTKVKKPSVKRTAPYSVKRS